MDASAPDDRSSNRSAIHDAVVVGAGFAGIYALYRLRKAGLAAIGFEAGEGVGGTWYWNRYPGAACDFESIEYSYSFDDALQQEWQWTTRMARQPEILAYLNHVTDRYDLRRDIQFSTRVVSAHFDDATCLWTVCSDRGHRITARHVVMATGCLSTPKPIEYPGRRQLQRPDPAHRVLAEGDGGFPRQAGRRRRHRFIGDPGDPDHRRAGSPSDRVPAHAELQHPGRQWTA